MKNDEIKCMKTIWRVKLISKLTQEEEGCYKPETGIQGHEESGFYELSVWRNEST